MKKFYLLFKKELKEMLTPQLWIPFFAVIIVFFIVGNVANKQMQRQSGTKDTIAVVDLDQSNLSRTSVEAVSQIGNTVSFSVSDDSQLIDKMKENKITVGLFIPQGFEKNILLNSQSNIKTYTQMDNFSVLAGKKLAIADSSVAVINELVSNTLINSRLNATEATKLKHPITAQSFVSANGKIKEGNASQLLAYIIGQITTIPVVLFVVIVMASQMIAAAVATEKENKTLETLLSLPISRKAIVVSKMLSAGIVSLAMAGIYMLGIKNFNSGINGMVSGSSVNNNITNLAQELGLKFSTTGYIELGLVLFLGILLALAIAMILGAFAEDAKSAQGIVAPLMILVMIPYFITLFMDVNSLSPIIRWIIYAIPFSHIFLAMSNILLANHIFIIAGAFYMFVLFIIFVVIAAKIFSSDLILTMRLNFAKKKR